MKVNPLVPSSVLCPFTGTAHLPRAFVKFAAGGKGVLADGYDQCGKGYDQMLLDGLGIGEKREAAIAAAQGSLYPAFVGELHKLGANFDAANVQKLNRSILGYNHTDDTRAGILGANGLTDDAGIKDAPTLNFLDDLAELVKALNPATAEAEAEAEEAQSQAPA